MRVVIEAIKEIRKLLFALIVLGGLAGGLLRVWDVFEPQETTTKETCEEVCYKGTIVIYCLESEDIYWSNEQCEDEYRSHPL